MVPSELWNQLLWNVAILDWIYKGMEDIDSIPPPSPKEKENSDWCITGKCRGVPLAKRFCSCSVSKSSWSIKYSVVENPLGCKFVEVLCWFSDVYSSVHCVLGHRHWLTSG